MGTKIAIPLSGPQAQDFVSNRITNDQVNAAKAPVETPKVFQDTSTKIEISEEATEAFLTQHSEKCASCLKQDNDQAKEIKGLTPSGSEKTDAPTNSVSDNKKIVDESDKKPKQVNEAGKTAAQEASEEKMLQELKARDAEVKNHEAAHMAAAGNLAQGGPSYDYKRGPDGHTYAVGGEVQIDTSKGSTPEETIQKAQRVRAAALAPANPSSQDRAVASRASSQEAEARKELADKQSELLKLASQSLKDGKNRSFSVAAQAYEQASKTDGSDAIPSLLG